jgi:hypothetical protein
LERTPTAVSDLGRRPLVEPGSFGGGRYRGWMQILAALFIDDINARSVPGPSTRLDITGVQFSLPAPTPPPVTINPHLVVIVRCAPGEASDGVLEVVFRRPGETEGDPVARSVQPLSIEPGKFAYRLVRADLEFREYEVIEAHCRVDRDPWTVVPLTLLAPPPQ